jgi:hypothetical protein
MLAVAARLSELALEHAAAIGLADQSAERDTVTIQMLLDAGSEDSAGHRALHGSPPSHAAISNRLFSLIHFSFAGGSNVTLSSRESIFALTGPSH